DFSIIELNGAGSEPTHIYDPRHSIFFAWKEIIRHWHILLTISRQNHQKKRIPYMSFSAGWQMLRENTAYVKKLIGSV
ncbi:MAG: D-alanine--D-alanine ligase, partial [Bacteroidota bacterium]|nr:D-alanine--D-alanine ligase [Bacteroidota bacterium]